MLFILVLFHFFCFNSFYYLICAAVFMEFCNDNYLQTAIICDAPMAPSDGFITPINRTIWFSGDVLSFTCNENFTLTGTQNITCTNDGVFENFTNECLGEWRFFFTFAKCFCLYKT